MFQRRRHEGEQPALKGPHYACYAVDCRCPLEEDFRFGDHPALMEPLRPALLQGPQAPLDHAPELAERR